MGLHGQSVVVKTRQKWTKSRPYTVTLLGHSALGEHGTPRKLEKTATLDGLDTLNETAEVS